MNKERISLTFRYIVQTQERKEELYPRGIIVKKRKKEKKNYNPRGIIVKKNEKIMR